MSRLHRKLLKAWESTQVELNGSYSSERVSDLAQYTRETSWFHITAVILLTPLPALLVTVAIDALPLPDPSEGVEANKFFWIREYYTFLVITFLAIEQFRYSLPILPYPLGRAIIHTVVVSAVSVGLMYGLALLIGFPLPFSILVVTPLWLSFISFFLGIEWFKKIRETPGALALLINVIKLWICQVMMVFIYPPYYFIFTTLSPNGQTAFSMLLPVIKLVMRNIYVKTVVHLSDELPEVITFNIEVYNALFISYCMQNSPSFGTTLMVTAALLTQLAMSLRDVYDATHRMENVRKLLGDEHQYGDPRFLILKSSVGGRKMSALQHADTLLPTEAEQQGVKRMSSIRVRPSNNFEKPLPPPGACIQPAPEPVKKRKRASQELSSTSLQYVMEVRRLMYLTEFLVLINYVGVFIPLIFSIYMAGMYQLPNRMYYAQLASLTKDEMYEALQNVMFNCSLKFLALVLLCSILQYKLRFSAAHQLAFVLEKQWFSVQTKVVFWVYYNVQCSLQHQGYDYNFHFSWLQQDAESIASNSTIPQTT